MHLLIHHPSVMQTCNFKSNTYSIINIKVNMDMLECLILKKQTKCKEQSANSRLFVNDQPISDYFKMADYRTINLLCRSIGSSLLLLTCSVIDLTFVQSKKSFIMQNIIISTFFQSNTHRICSRPGYSQLHLINWKTVLL